MVTGFDPPDLERPGRLPHQQGPKPLLSPKSLRGEAGLPRQVTPIGGPVTRVSAYKAEHGQWARTGVVVKSGGMVVLMPSSQVVVMSDM